MADVLLPNQKAWPVRNLGVENSRVMASASLGDMMTGHRKRLGTGHCMDGVVTDEGEGGLGAGNRRALASACSRNLMTGCWSQAKTGRRSQMNIGCSSQYGSCGHYWGDGDHRWH